MLTSLTIQQFVIIEKVQIAFAPTLTVLTGETGAGKSILLDALELVLGARADTSLIRHGAEEASIIATFDVAKNTAILTWLKEREITIDEGEELVIKRVISRSGKTKALLNDQAISVALLKELGEQLLVIHRQFEQFSLTRPEAYVECLDQYAGLIKQRIKLGDAYRMWREASGAVTERRQALERAERERDYLTHALTELRSLNPVEGEEDILAEKRKRLQQMEQCAEQIQTLRQLLQRNRPSEGLQEFANLLHKMPDTFSQSLTEAREQIERACIEAEEAERSLEALQQQDWGTEESLEAIEERLFALRAMARKHQSTVSELPTVMARFAQDLKDLDHSGELLAALEKKAHAAEAEYREQAEALSKKRQTAAQKLSRAIVEECAPLKLEQIRFEVKLEPLPIEQATASGMDAVTFMLSTNPGVPLQPLHAIASGGEMSRLMLVLSVLTERNASRSLVFDEIDTGVGGAVADAVGRRLKLLAEETQVLTITHHPQVTAYAAQHIKIEKIIEKNQTRTIVKQLSMEERADEIARMLSGAAVTEEARAAAHQLMRVSLHA